jgi:hypothetical protein
MDYNYQMPEYRHALIEGGFFLPMQSGWRITRGRAFTDL